MRNAIHKFGKFYSNIMINMIGIFIFVGILSVIFGDYGWVPNENIYAISQFVYSYVIPALIAYAAGNHMGQIYEKRPDVPKTGINHAGGAIAVMAAAGIMIADKNCAILGAMILGPICGLLWKNVLEPLTRKAVQGMEMLFALFGGLAMFLYGMDRMSRALQRAAGDAMKRLLARLTATPLLGVLTGLAVTAVLQSSSAATVMVIGFVSAGLLELPRAVAVIYGINIGTTMTAQLIAFDVQTLVYPVLFLGFLLDFAARRPRWQAVGEAVFSFGLLFEGIDILGRALQPLAGQAVFLEWMTRVKESPLLGILLGLCMTMVVQSSSATIALLQNVARQAGPDGIHSVLGLAGAVPVLLGDNIGTTVTALLACIGQGKDAARAALAHSCFNLSGSLLAAMLLPWFVRLVEFISPKGPELEVISRQIANAHTAFNVCCALLWLPFLPWMVRLVCALVPEDR